MTFALPYLLWLLLVPAVASLLEIARRRRTRDTGLPKVLHGQAGTHTFTLAAPGTPPRATTPRVRWRLWLALACAAVALARPQWGTIDEKVFDQSREIMVAIDLSRSMLADDIRPSRLERARLLVRGLLERLQGERVGLLVFAGTAFLQSPLSADYEVLEEFLPELDPDFLPEGGSNYEALLDAALDSFGTGAADRFLIILSDGDSTTDGWRNRIPKLRTRGIRVLGLGIGTETGAMIPDSAGGFVKDERGAVVLSRLAPATLQTLASETGGAYTDASGWVDLAAILQRTVEQGRTGDFVEQREVRRIERFQWPLAAGFVFLLWSFWREVPVHPRSRRVWPGPTTTKSSALTPPPAVATAPAGTAPPVLATTAVNARVATVTATASPAVASLLLAATLAFTLGTAPRAGAQVRKDPSFPPDPEAAMVPDPKPAAPRTLPAAPPPAPAPSRPLAAPSPGAPGTPTAAAPAPDPYAEPLVQLATALANAGTPPSAADYKRFAETTLTYAHRKLAANDSPPPRTVYDALAAVDRGEALDPKAADWPDLRSQLEALFPPAEQDQKNPEDSEQQKQEQQDQQSGEEGQPQSQEQSEPNEDPSKNESSTNTDQQKGADAEKKERPDNAQSAFGDMQQEPPPPEPADASEAPQPDPADQQKVGGQQEKAAADPARENPSLAVPLQKLDQLKQQDAPARLFQLMEGERTPTRPKKDW